MDTPTWGHLVKQDLLILFICTIATLKLFSKYSKLSFSFQLISCLFIASAFFIGLLESVTLLLFLSSATLYGEIIRKKLSPSYTKKTNPPHIELVISLSVGMIFLMWVLGISAHFPINYSVSHLALLSLPFLLFYSDLCVLFFKIKTAAFDKEDNNSLLVDLSFYLFSFLIIVHYVYAALPESFHDATSVYFPISEYLKSNKVWHFDPTKAVYATMSFGAVWLEASIYRFGGEIAAKLLCWISSSFSAVLIYSILRREGVSKILSALSSCLFLSIGTVFLISISMFYDAHLMFITTSAYYLATKKDAEKELITIALLSAGAITIKISALFPVAAIVIFCLIDLYKKHGFKSLNRITIPTLLGLIIATPPYIYSYIKTGNPFFPFMNGFFKSSFLTAENIITPLPGKLSPKILYNMTFKTGEYLESYNGSFGFIFLLFIPSLLWLLLFERKNRLLLFSLCATPFVILQLKMDHNIRYLTQFMPIFICAISLSISTLVNKKNLLSYLLFPIIIVVIWFNFHFISSASGPIRNIRPLTAFIPSKALEFKKHFASQITIAQRVASSFPVRAKILSLNAGGLGAVDADLSYYTWYNSKLFAELIEAKSMGEFDAIFRKWGITHVIERQDNQYYNHKNLHTYLQDNSSSKMTMGANIAYTLKDNVIFSRQYSINSDLDTGIENWELNKVSRLNTPFLGARVSTKGHLSQNFPSLNKRNFKLEITYLCTTTPQFLRVHVSFVDKDSEYLSGEIWDTLCRSKEEVQKFERIFSSPEDTARISFAAEAFDHEILIDSISLIGSE